MVDKNTTWGGLVVTSALTSAEVSLTSGSRSPDETDGAAGSVTHSIFVRFKCLFCGEGYRFRTFATQCHMTSQIKGSGKQSLVMEVCSMESKTDDALKANEV